MNSAFPFQHERQVNKVSWGVDNPSAVLVHRHINSNSNINSNSSNA